MTQKTFPDDAVFSVRRDLVLEQVDDEFLVLDPRGNEFFGLNDVAKTIWDAVERGASFVEIVGELCDGFEVEPDDAARDLEEFLSTLLDQHLISRD